MNNKFIYCSNGEHKWETYAFMTPQGIKLKEDSFRIYGGVRDNNGISRIKYIDVDEKKPEKIIRISERPVLDIGNPGCFDDNGMILGDVIHVKDRLYMYYVGFQHVEKVKFYAFSGVAISDDEGESFERYSETPIMDRTTTGRFGRCIHTVLYDDDVFKCYYAVINDWKVICGTPYPVYNIWYTESKDGIHFDCEDKVLCVDTIGDEYRIGRPKVYKTSYGYEMFYTRDLITKKYLAGYAISKDGICWTRKDEDCPLVKSGEKWDSDMACYPVRMNTAYGRYLIYNGNGQGATGIGYQRL